jgi:hypothetical protein
MVQASVALFLSVRELFNLFPFVVSQSDSFLVKEYRRHLDKEPRVIRGPPIIVRNASLALIRKTGISAHRQIADTARFTAGCSRLLGSIKTINRQE